MHLRRDGYHRRGIALKILLYCGLELFVALFTGIIIEYFDREKILKANLTFLAIFFMIFLFCPKGVSQSGGHASFQLYNEVIWDSPLLYLWGVLDGV